MIYSGPLFNHYLLPLCYYRHQWLSRCGAKRIFIHLHRIKPNHQSQSFTLHNIILTT